MRFAESLPLNYTPLSVSSTVMGLLGSRTNDNNFSNLSFSKVSWSTTIPFFGGFCFFRRLGDILKLEMPPLEKTLLSHS